MKTQNSGITGTSILVYLLLAFLAAVLLVSDRSLSKVMVDLGTRISDALGL